MFNICTTNADNHLRNHGFLLVGEGWRLSPAFDVNPAYDREYLELSIGGEDRRDIHAAIEAADFFRLSRRDAIQRAREIQAIIRNNWKKLALKYHLEAREIELMRPAFTETEREL